MKLQSFIERILANYYSEHPQGEELLLLDLQMSIDEGFLVPDDNSPYGILESENENLKSKIHDLELYVEELEEDKENEILYTTQEEF